MKKNILFFLIVIVLYSCHQISGKNDIAAFTDLSNENNKSGVVTGTLSKERLTELAYNNEYIGISREDGGDLYEKFVMGKDFNLDSLNLYRVVLYRFHSKLIMKDKLLYLPEMTAEDLGIAETTFKHLKRHLDLSMENLAKRMREGKDNPEIREDLEVGNTNRLNMYLRFESKNDLP